MPDHYRTLEAELFDERERGARVVLDRVAGAVPAEAVAWAVIARYPIRRAEFSRLGIEILEDSG
jgi:hypothetical protein